MSKVICIAGESGSGKTTSMRNLDPKSTYYIDADKKGLSWKGWRKRTTRRIKIILRVMMRMWIRQYIKLDCRSLSGVSMVIVSGYN